MCAQAIRVTQEQRGSLKLEAYLRLLQDMIVMQLQQASVMHSASPQVSTHHASQHCLVVIYILFVISCGHRRIMS